jgi:hypothetical protein
LAEACRKAGYSTTVLDDQTFPEALMLLPRDLSLLMAATHAGILAELMKRDTESALLQAELDALRSRLPELGP